ncbi:glycosyltransferase family 39 protein [Nocardia sp. NPDC005978]|uniref:ArnT family glycosyltransferase n=1 Tax=unclassified Nocardia TaxID=2637762 RepID=UPI0033A6FB44
MTLTQTAAPAPAVAPPRFAWRGVLLVSGVLTLIWSVSAARFQYAGDELYYLACGRRLAVSYADNGPLVPLIARLCDLIAPGSEFALRVPGLLMLVVASALAGAVACELGARARLQMLAAAGFAASPLVFAFTVLTSVSFDIALQALILWLLIRWVRVRRDRLLVAAGVAAAIDVQDKWLVLLLAACVGAGVLVAGPREILGRPALWLGLIIGAASMTPALLWQATHDWPQLATNEAIAQENSAAVATVVAIMVTTGFLGGGLGLLGLYGLAREPRLRPYRFLLIAIALMLVLVVAAHGRSYYVAGLLPALFGAGAATLSGLLGVPATRVAWRRTFVTLTALAAALTAFVALLPFPRSWIVQPPRPPLGALQHYGNDYWSDLADAVHEVTANLPAADRANAAIVASSYGQAGALDHYGQSGWLPPVYSPHRGFAGFGPPPDTTGTFVYVGHETGREQREFLAAFTDTTLARRVHDPLGIGGQNFGMAIWICRGPRVPMSEAWPTLTYMVAPPTP